MHPGCYTKAARSVALAPSDFRPPLRAIPQVHRFASHRPTPSADASPHPALRVLPLIPPLQHPLRALPPHPIRGSGVVPRAVRCRCRWPGHGLRWRHRGGGGGGGPQRRNRHCRGRRNLHAAALLAHLRGQCVEGDVCGAPASPHPIPSTSGILAHPAAFRAESLHQSITPNQLPSWSRCASTWPPTPARISQRRLALSTSSTLPPRSATPPPPLPPPPHLKYPVNLCSFT